MMRFTIVLVSLVAACAAPPPPDVQGNGNGNGNGTGTGNGDGSGSGSGTGTGTPTGSTTATMFLQQMDQKFCDEAFTCKASFPTNQGVTFDQAFGASAQACYADAAQANPPAVIEQQITAGTIMFNAADAATCLAGIAFGSCTEFWQQGPTMPAACDTALVGTIADGQACVTTIECANLVSYCDETTHKCTVDTGGQRTLPDPGAPWQMQVPALLRAMK